MNAKMLEVRDDGTFIPVLAVRLEPGCERDRALLGRAGYGTTIDRQSQYFLLVTLSTQPPAANHDPMTWPGRTLREAHLYVEKNWSKLLTGDVVDVEYILGETASPKESEVL